MNVDVVLRGVLYQSQVAVFVVVMCAGLVSRDKKRGCRRGGFGWIAVDKLTKL